VERCVVSLANEYVELVVCHGFQDISMYSSFSSSMSLRITVKPSDEK
jgi:hypothetical protein